MHFLDPRAHSRGELPVRTRTALLLCAIAGAIEGSGTRAQGLGKSIDGRLRRFAGLLRARAYVVDAPEAGEGRGARGQGSWGCWPKDGRTPLENFLDPRPQPQATTATATDPAEPADTVGGPGSTTLSFPAWAVPARTEDPRPATADALTRDAGPLGVESRGRTSTPENGPGVGVHTGAGATPHSPPHSCEVRVDPGAEGSPPPPATPVAPTHGWLSPAQIAAHHAGEFCGVAGCSSCEFCRAVCADIGIKPTRRLGWRTAPDMAKVG